MKKTYELVCKTIDSVEKYGMAVGLKRDFEGPTCLLGHIQRSLGMEPIHWGVVSVASELPEAKRLEKELRKMFRRSISSWNDINGYQKTIHNVKDVYSLYGLYDLEGLKAKALKALRKVKRKVR